MFETGQTGMAPWQTGVEGRATASNAGYSARASGVSSNLSVIALHALQGFAPGSAALVAAPPFSVARRPEGPFPNPRN
jgi:hypothetical protein